MRQRLKVDAATEEDEPGWVQVESPKNSSIELAQAKDGSGLQVSENLQSYMQTGNQMTTEEYKRGRKLLSEKKGTYLFCSILLYDTRTHSQSFFCSICFLFFVSLHFYFQYSPVLLLLAIEETEKAKGRQAALAKEEWDTVKHYFLVGTIFLFLVWAFFRFGPVLKKNNAPGNTNNPVVQQLKESANEAFGEPLANILLPGLRI